MADVPSPKEDILLTHFIVSDDVLIALALHTEVLGGRVAFSNPEGHKRRRRTVWIVMNSGGGPTDDKPEVTLEMLCDPIGERLRQHPGQGHGDGVLRLERAGVLSS